MSTAIQRRRGTTAQHASFAGLNGELTVDTDKEVVVVHDGATAGGYPMMRENGSNSALALGSAGTPSLKFTGDTNTGIYSPGADQVAISTGGSGRLFITNGGNVGVGVSSPQGKLTVSNSGAEGIEFNPGYASGLSSILAYNRTTSAHTELGFEATQFPFRISGTERMRLDSSGRLGVGTSSPQQLLQVGGFSGSNGITVGAGSSNYSFIYLADGTGGTEAYRGYLQYNHATDKLELGSAGATAVTIDSSQRVGIGTSSPSCTLQVSGSSTVSSQVNVAAQIGPNVTSDLLIGSVNGNTPFIASQGAYPLQLRTNNAVALTVDSSQRVGIGTTSPLTIFDVKPSSNRHIVFSASASYASNAVVGVDDAGSEIAFGIAGKPIQFFVDGNEAARLDTSKRLLVGTSTNRSIGGINSRLQVEGVDAVTSSLSITRNTDTTSPPYLMLGKSRGGAVNTNTIVQNGDTLGSIEFCGADGNDLDQAAATIQCQVDGTPGSNDMPGRLVFSTTADGASSPTEHFRVSQNGIFRFTTNGSYTNSNGTYNEIYQTNPSVSLYVRNTHGSNPYGFQVYYDTAVNNTGSEFLYCGDSAQRATIRSNGGLANFQANNVNLSDINTKKDISPATGTWDCIKEWEIVNYRYKDQSDDSDLNLGVIAQQVAESCPEVITVFQEAKEATEDQPAQEERLGIKEQQMYWMAIKALQEAQVRIEALEAEVAALKAQ